ncbi:hypothetical protein ACOMHN_030273 [Nucella lapillus]
MKKTDSLSPSPLANRPSSTWCQKKVFIGLHALSSPGHHCSVAADALFGHHASAIGCSTKLKSSARKEKCSFCWLMELRRLL